MYCFALHHHKLRSYKHKHSRNKQLKSIRMFFMYLIRKSAQIILSIKTQVFTLHIHLNRFFAEFWLVSALAVSSYNPTLQLHNDIICIQTIFWLASTSPYIMLIPPILSCVETAGKGSLPSCYLTGQTFLCGDLRGV